MNPYWTVGTIVIRWFLGVLSTAGFEQFRRWRNIRDFTQAVLGEIAHLRFRLALLVILVRMHNAELSNEIIDEMLPFVEAYRGSDRDERLCEGVRHLRRVPEDQRVAACRSMDRQALGSGMTEVSLATLNQITELVTCKADFQNAVLHIRYRLNHLNQLAKRFNSLSEKTFNNMPSSERDALDANVTTTLRAAQVQAEIMVRAITELQRKYKRRALRAERHIDWQ